MITAQVELVLVVLVPFRAHAASRVTERTGCVDAHDVAKDDGLDLQVLDLRPVDVALLVCHGAAGVAVEELLVEYLDGGLQRLDGGAVRLGVRLLCHGLSGQPERREADDPGDAAHGAQYCECDLPVHVLNCVYEYQNESGQNAHGVAREVMERVLEAEREHEGEGPEEVDELLHCAHGDGDEGRADQRTDPPEGDNYKRRQREVTHAVKSYPITGGFGYSCKFFQYFHDCLFREYAKRPPKAYEQMFFFAALAFVETKLYFCGSIIVSLSEYPPYHMPLFDGHKNELFCLRWNSSHLHGS